MASHLKQFFTNVSYSLNWKVGYTHKIFRQLENLKQRVDITKLPVREHPRSPACIYMGQGHRIECHSILVVVSGALPFHTWRHTCPLLGHTVAEFCLELYSSERIKYDSEITWISVIYLLEAKYYWWSTSIYKAIITRYCLSAIVT